MLSEEMFKTKYREAEDSVPVNEELKRRLLETARAVEAGECPAELDREIPVKPTVRAGTRVIRHNIMKAAALAACLAVCAVSLPRLSDLRGGEPQPRPAAIAGATAAPTAEPAGETEAPREKEPAETRKPSEPEGEAERTVPRKTAAPKTKPAAEIPAAPKTKSEAEIPAAETKPEAEISAPAEAGTAAEPETKQENAQREEQPAQSEPEEHPPVKVAESGKEELLSSRDEFSRRMTLLERQRGKLEDWDAELKVYEGQDEVFDAIYLGFAGDSARYGAAADGYIEKYGGAEDETELQSAIAEYDASLGDEGELFEACRESYRRGANYIEMSGMNAEEAQSATEGAENEEADN